MHPRFIFYAFGVCFAALSLPGTSGLYIDKQAFDTTHESLHCVPLPLDTTKADPGAPDSATIETLSAQQFKQLLTQKKLQLVDVRTAPEYREGAIAGAIHIDVQKNDFECRADSLLKKEIPVAVYCKSGVRSKKAATKLARKGFKIYNLDGGYAGWIKKYPQSR